MKKNENGFTLIELLIVVGTIALVAAIAAPMITRMVWARDYAWIKAFDNQHVAVVPCTKPGCASVTEYVINEFADAAGYKYYPNAQEQDTPGAGLRIEVLSMNWRQDTITGKYTVVAEVDYTGFLANQYMLAGTSFSVTDYGKSVAPALAKLIVGRVKEAVDKARQ